MILFKLWSLFLFKNHFSISDCIRNKDEYLEIKLKYIDEEIDIRVESLKIEIETIGAKLKQKLDEMREDVFKLL